MMMFLRRMRKKSRLLPAEHGPLRRVAVDLQRQRRASDLLVGRHGAVKLGSETMSNIGVKGDAAAHKLDRECGKKK